MNRSTAKLYSVLTLMVIFLMSCGSSTKETSMSDSGSHKSSTIIKNVDQTDSSDIKSTIYTQRVQGITPLPFGEKAWPAEQANIKSNYLPVISKVTYVLFGEQIGMTCLDNGRIDTLFKPAKYKNRLPDIGIYESYYVVDIDNEFRDNCLLGSQDYQCLLLYDRAKKEAKVLNLHYVYYIDSMHNRSFYIDENYTIHLIEKQFTDGDPDSKDRVTGVPEGTGYRKINILPNGTIKVTSGK